MFGLFRGRRQAQEEDDIVDDEITREQLMQEWPM